MCLHKEEEEQHWGTGQKKYNSDQQQVGWNVYLYINMQINFINYLNLTRFLWNIYNDSF